MSPAPLSSLDPTQGTPAASPVPLDCQSGVLGFFHTIERLKTNKRTGWVNQGIDKPESIADHMYRMAMMCLAFPEIGQLDIAKCVMLSIVHDMAEADVGDITPEHASGVSKETKLALESKAMERYQGLLGHPSIPSVRIKDLWNEYEDRITPESKFVKDLDLLELCVQAVEYENSQGCKTLQEFFETTLPRILHPVVKGWARELLAERKKKWEERGWEGYVEVAVRPDNEEESGAPVTTNGTSSSSEERPRLPIKVWGEHKDEE